MTDDAPPPLWGEKWFAEVNTARRFMDAWAVMRDLSPADADVPLLLTAQDAAHRLVLRIMDAERRDGLSKETAWLLDLARAKVIGRIAMLDNWRRHLQGTASSSIPPGEDSRYARTMRMPPEMLARVIAEVERTERDEPSAGYGPEVLEILRRLPNLLTNRSSVLIGPDDPRWNSEPPAIDWSQCPDVESVPDRCGGA